MRRMLQKYTGGSTCAGCYKNAEKEGHAQDVTKTHRGMKVQSATATNNERGFGA